VGARGPSPAKVHDTARNLPRGNEVGDVGFAKGSIRPNATVIRRLRAPSKALALECVIGRIHPAGGEWRQGVGAGVEEVGKEEDGVAEVDDAVVVDVVGVCARWGCSPTEEEGEQEDAIANIDGPIAGALAADEEGGLAFIGDATGIGVVAGA